MGPNIIHISPTAASGGRQSRSHVSPVSRTLYSSSIIQNQLTAHFYSAGTIKTAFLPTKRLVGLCYWSRISPCCVSGEFEFLPCVGPFYSSSSVMLFLFVFVPNFRTRYALRLSTPESCLTIK